MATLKRRLHRKNSSGGYDTVHIETSSDLVKRPDGTTVEAALTELKTSVSNGKSAVASAITDKGVSTSATAEFATMASNIRAIPQLDTSDATATAAQLLTGSTAYVKGSKITGSMANQGAKSASLNCGGSYAIPAGYHNGSGRVTANSLASQTDATATAAQILSGYTAWVKGTKLTGTASAGTIVKIITTSSQTFSVDMGVTISNVANVKIYGGSGPNGPTGVYLAVLVNNRTAYVVYSTANSYAVYSYGSETVNVSVNGSIVYVSLPSHGHQWSAYMYGYFAVIYEP